MTAHGCELPGAERPVAKIERVVLDPAYLAAREARLRAQYRPRTWADCVSALVGKLDQPPDAR